MESIADGREPRFDLRRRLGAGGFGEVFEAWDRERDSIVALKRLKRLSPTSIRRFKHEFRSLAHLSHPNLAQLYELVSDGEEWSFTMELVDGHDFVTAIRGGARQRSADIESDGPGRPNYDAVRLRGCLRQLVRGVCALHAAGKLHRDLKPHNVLVTDHGRVVILDFGMVSELGQAEVDPSQFAGTPHYMAPEQVGSAPTTTAADWYSVGVMLFELLVGEYPVEGRTVVQLLLRKQCAESPSNEVFPADTPVDLQRLCQALLELEPKRRPTGEQLLDMLGDFERPVAQDVVVREPDLDGSLLGRDHELAQLDAGARSVASESRPRLAALIGPSGIGKSALGWRFAAAQRDGGALVWTSRCWENESVPYKALDGIVDSLVLYLSSLPESALDGLLSGHVAALARVFPAFDQLAVVRDFAAARPASSDEPATRRAAFRALRAFLHGITLQRRVVLLIDDAHWGDRDSADALLEIFGRRDPPPIYVVLTYRGGEVEDSPFLRTLTSQLEVPTDHIELGRLDASSANELARACGASEERAAEITRESGGDPYLIQQLSDSRQTADTGAATILGRIDALGDEDRAFIAALTIASRPMEAALIHAVAAVQTDLTHILARLTNQRLLRQRVVGGGTAVECYHDRVRQALRQQMPVARSQALHLRFAQTLDARGVDDPELLALHYRHGGEVAKSAIYTRTAAQMALEHLAYDRAATGYAAALRDGDWPDADRREMQTQLGTVLSYLGRGSESAEAFVRAAGHGSAVESIALRRRAAEQLLRSGQFERGLDLLNTVLADVGVNVPSSDAALNTSLVANVARTWWRGDAFEEREQALDPLEAERQDTIWAAANLMGTLDVKRGAYYTLLNVQRSLGFGDLHRVGRTLALQAVHSASRAGTRSRAAGLLDQAEALIDRAGDPLMLSAMVSFCRGMAAYMSGELRTAHLRFADVERRLSHEGRFVWERKLVEIYDLYNQYHLGQLSRLAEQVHEGAADALGRDDMLQWSGIVTWGHLVRLIEDRPDVALEELAAAAAAWQVPGGLLLNDFWRLQAQVRVALYTGRPADALALLRDSWNDLRRGLFLSLDLTLAIVLDLRARATLGLAAQQTGPSQKALLRAAVKDSRRLAKIGMPWASAMAELIRGQTAWLTGDLSSAKSAFARAETGLGSQGYELLLSAVRVRLGTLTGSDDLRDRSLDWLASRGVVDVERFVTMIIPVRGHT